MERKLSINKSNNNPYRGECDIDWPSCVNTTLILKSADSKPHIRYVMHEVDEDTVSSIEKEAFKIVRAKLRRNFVDIMGI